MPDNLLPIKVVFPSDTDFRAPGGTPHGWDPICTVTPQLRQQLAAEVRSVLSTLRTSSIGYPTMPGVARITLRDEAKAKSYRPALIFNEATCPVIGGGAAGELFVSASQVGLQLVESRFSSTTQGATAHISTVERIEPYVAEVHLEPTEASQRRKSTAIRVRLFEHPSDAVNQAIEAHFVALARDGGASDVRRLPYAPGLRIYRLDNLTPNGLGKLSRFVGLQSVSRFPRYQLVRTEARVLTTNSDAEFPPPDPSVNYGLVGIIDSGTNPADQFLQAWVLQRYEKWVPRVRQNTDHGSFVAGLIANGRFLNHNDKRFPAAAARIVDVVAFDKDSDVSEDDLLLIIDDAIATFPTVKVWNLSFSLHGGPCEDMAISELGAAIDERARTHGVLFVIASGNYRSPPFRSWPPKGTHDDRVRPPADSVRAVTVGGLAHVDTASTVVRREEPSPFSRHGPASCGIFKPELSHYAGNCDARGHHIQTGIISVDGSGHIAENIGTSFACPPVSAILSNIHRELDTGSVPAITPTLAKAMLAHSCFVKNGPPKGDHVQYRGLGAPGDVDEVLHCSPSAATIIAQVDVRPRPLFEKRPFPMPRCLLKEGRLQCEVFMTIVYDCPLDARFDLEYCRNNVLASLGTVSIGPDGKEKYDREVRPVPDRMNEQYEADLYDYGYLWSPLKLYYRRFSRGPDLPWRLTLRAMNRAENDDTEPQRVVLLVTIRSFVATDPVYNELVQEMNRLGWATADLQIRSRVRQRGRR